MDLASWSKQNLSLTKAGELVVRPALYSEDTPGSGVEYVAGFSLRSPNTGSVFFYLVTRSAGDGTLSLTTETGEVLQTVDLGPIPRRPHVTHAAISSPHVSSLEMLIGGPDLPTLYGYVGSGLVRAEKVEDDDPNSDALDIPRGIVTGFAGRAVIASRKNLYFSNGYGTASTDGEAAFTGPRTYSAVNLGDMAAIVYSLHLAVGGVLIIVTDRGVWALPPEAVAQGLKIADIFQRVSDYGATGYGQTCLSRGRLYGLSELGLTRVTDEAEIALDEPRYPRAIAAPIEVADYRSCRIWPTDRGVIVAHSDGLCEVDEVRAHRSWQTAVGVDLEVVGVLREREGRELIVTPDAIYSFHGTDETVVGVAAGLLQTPPQGSLQVREVTTSSDTGATQRASVRGSAVRSKDTPQAGAVIGTDTWSASETYQERAIRSRRHRFAVRTDDPTVEVAAEGCGSRLGLVDVVLKSQGRRRP